MRRVFVAGGSLGVSRLAFGTGSLHHQQSRRARVGLLEAAVDAGFSHFDTSPLYGFGLAEEDLGALDDRVRRSTTVSTKVGLYPPDGARPNGVEVVVRKALGRMMPALSTAVVDWSLDRARSSLETSLRRLRRDSVEVLLLHEGTSEVLSTDEWQHWLEDVVTRGKVGAVGVAGEAHRFVSWLAGRERRQFVVQTRDSVLGDEARAVAQVYGAPDFVYGYLSAPPRASASEMRGRLEAGLQRWSEASLIVSTRVVGRLTELAALGER